MRPVMRRIRPRRYRGDFPAVRLAGRMYRGTKRQAARAGRAAGKVRARAARSAASFRRRKPAPQPRQERRTEYTYTIRPPRAAKEQPEPKPEPQAMGHIEPRPQFTARTPEPKPRTGGGGSHMERLTELIREGFAGFHPENAADLRQMFDDIPEMFASLASGVSALAAKFGEELPVDPAIAEGVGELSTGLAALHDQGDRLKSVFEQAHEAELARIDSPRPNEELWDTPGGQAG